VNFLPVSLSPRLHPPGSSLGQRVELLPHLLDPRELLQIHRIFKARAFEL
jgi:hypothetical protein